MTIAIHLYYLLTADVIADVFLLATSLHLFLVIQDKVLRIRLSCLFSTCILTTAVSFVNSSFILNSGGMKVIIIAIVEVRKFLNCYFAFPVITENWMSFRAAYLLSLPTSQLSIVCLYRPLNTLLREQAEAYPPLFLISCSIPIHRHPKHQYHVRLIQ